MAFAPGTWHPRRSVRSIAAALAALFLIAWPPAPMAQSGSLRFSTSAGYDDDVLGRPGEARDLPVLEQWFLQLSPTLAGSLEKGPFRLEASYGYVFNAYESAEVGAYQDHRGLAEIAWQALPRLRFSVEGSAEWFRRSEFHDFDQDRLEATPRLTWQPRPSWSADASVHAGSLRYPERVVSLVDGRTVESVQTDTPLDVELSLAWRRPDGRWGAALGGTRLDTGSNQSRFRYHGIQGWFRGEAPAPLGVHLGLEAILEGRDYDEFRVVVKWVRRPGGGLPVPVIGTRSDHSTLVVLDAGRRVSSRLDAFVQVSRMDYHSNAAGYSFNETRLQAGLEVQLGPWGKGPVAADGLPGGGQSVAGGAPGGLAVGGGAGADSTLTETVAGLAPVIEKESARLRCRAPGARSVALVGSFNAWRPEAMPMVSLGGGLWEIRIPLAPGTYRYMFLVDGEIWQRPEAATLYEDDGYGLENGILDIP